MPPISVRLVSVALALTGVINIIAGLVFLVQPAWYAQLMLSPDLVIDGYLLRYHYVMWAFVLAMGVGYGVASRDPSRYTALILAGSLGKLIAAALWVEAVISGFGSVLLLGGVAFDGSLGLLFLAFLAGQAGTKP